MSLIIEYAISLSKAGFSLGDILTVIMLAYVLKGNMAATNSIANGITTLIYQSKNKYWNEEETEKEIDKLFKRHTAEKWIAICDVMDENGYKQNPESQETKSRIKQVKDGIAKKFDTITIEEKDDLNEYLTYWGAKIGTKFYEMYNKIRECYLKKVYEIIFAGTKRTTKKREFYNLCESELAQIKSKLRN